MNTFYGHTKSVMCMQFDGNRLISSGYDGVIRLWDIPTNTGDAQPQKTILKNFKPEKAITALKYDDMHLVVGSYDSYLCFADFGDENVAFAPSEDSLKGKKLAVLLLFYSNVRNAQLTPVIRRGVYGERRRTHQNVETADCICNEG
jgi:WD40 repeat protein